jgi:multidrug transporter EmrE-like cation transporter
MHYILLIIGPLLTVAADYFAKMWADNNRPIYAIVSLLSYAISGAIFIAFLTIGKKLVVYSALWTMVVYCVTTIIGLLFFKEKLNTMQTVAVVLGTLSVMLFTHSELNQ